MNPTLGVEPLTDGRAGWRLAGEIDLSNRDRFEDLLATSATRQCGPDGLVHFELSALTFIDLAGTRSLVRTAERLNDRCGGWLALHDPPYTLRRVAALLLGAIDEDGDGCLTLPAHC